MCANTVHRQLSALGGPLFGRVPASGTGDSRWGIDPKQLNFDMDKFRESQTERAIRDVRATLLLDRISEVEAVSVGNDEVDREVHRLARQQREPVAAVRLKLEKDDGLDRIANRIRTDKTISLLFEQARKVAPVAPVAAEQTGTAEVES